MPEHPNLFVDTAWWNPADLVALFTLAPPGQLLWASDSPYGAPLISAAMALRCAVQAGLGPEALRSIAGAQMQRLLAGEPAADAGPPPGRAHALDPLLERVVAHLIAAMARGFSRSDPEESVALARLACAVGEESPDAHVFAAVLELLDLYAEHRHVPPGGGRPFPPAGRFLAVALTVARTPAAPLPERAEAPTPTRAEAERAAGA
jgi:uncharacterized protein